MQIPVTSMEPEGVTDSILVTAHHTGLHGRNITQGRRRAPEVAVGESGRGWLRGKEEKPGPLPSPLPQGKPALA